MVKESGILFTPENIRRVREGRKTQTRRVMTPQPPPCNHKSWEEYPDNIGQLFPTEFFRVDAAEWACQVCGNGVTPLGNGIRCPFGTVGDRLYVKEGVIVHVSLPDLVGYYMDGCRVTEHWEKRLTAMFMPKYAARLWLEITDVRVQRVQEISEADAIAEGVEETPYSEQDIADIQISDAAPHIKQLAAILGPGRVTATGNFMMLWDSINAKKHPWSSNPWVFALTFRKLEAR